MKLNFKTISLGSLAAAALLIAPLAWVHSADANGDGRGGPHLEQLDLTEEQSAQIEAIRTDARSQMEALLTPEQQATLENSESPREAWRSLDLSDEQREQMRAIRETSREQIRAVLTDEQQQRLEEMRSERRGGHHGRAGGHRGRGLEQLDLTDEQSSQIESIRENSRSQMEALLTPEQQATLESSESPREAWRSLDLSDEQREQMRAIHEVSHEQIRAVLTDEQRQQLEEMRPERSRDNQQSQL